jgi:hypothetical protein
MSIVEDYLEARPIREREAVLGANARRVWALDRAERTSGTRHTAAESPAGRTSS